MKILKRSKKKNEAFDYNKYISEFIDFKDSIDKNNEYVALNNLYSEIYKFYKGRMQENDFDISIERILLEKRAGKYNGEKYKANISIMLGFFCALTPVYIQGFVELNPSNKAIIYILSTLVAFGVVYRELSKSVDSDKGKDVVYNVSLKVLSCIEKEIELKKVKGYNKAEAKVEDINSDVNSKSGINPIVLEIAATLLDKDSIVRRIFRKIKR
ncbi:hypothetical protein [Clostridium sp. C8-1-8]|uniref:hypothetical protein n=1 Tax=Clostridium sp. C8-1-8 TaxID=2698831 RepID=UPI00136CD7B3|nr:hypothetical protein [Clostridium sp. C8-1-8]